MRLTSVTVGSLVAASATKIATSQTAPASQALALQNGTGYVVNNISTSQSPGGAGNLTITGSLAQSGVAYLSPASSVVVASGSNDTGITYTITGTSAGPRGAYAASEVLTGSNAGITATKTLFTTVTKVAVSGAATTLTVGTNGTVYTLDTPRRVLLTSGGNDTGITLKVTGTDWNGNTLVETLAGGNPTVYTVNDFQSVTQVLPSAATASTITVGTNGIASSRPIFFDTWSPSQTSIQCTATGTVNYTVQASLDNPNEISGAVPANTAESFVGIPINWVSSADALVVGATGTVQSNFAYLPSVARLLLNSGTGSVTMRVIQASNGPR